MAGICYLIKNHAMPPTYSANISSMKKINWRTYCKILLMKALLQW